MTVAVQVAFQSACQVSPPHWVSFHSDPPAHGAPIVCEAQGRAANPGSPTLFTGTLWPTENLRTRCQDLRQCRWPGAVEDHSRPAPIAPPAPLQPRTSRRNAASGSDRSPLVAAAGWTAREHWLFSARTRERPVTAILKTEASA